MPEKAQVKSIDAIESFRSNLIVYVSQARPALEEVSAEVLRLRSWLENEQRTFWENQIRKRTKELEQIKQALFSGRLGVMQRESAADQIAFHRARQALEEAESKLRLVKKWAREFDARVQPMLKQTEKLHTVLSNDIVKAVALLAQTLNTLSAYAEVPISPAETPPPPTSNAPASEPKTEATGPSLVPNPVGGHVP